MQFGVSPGCEAAPGNENVQQKPKPKGHRPNQAKAKNTGEVGKRAVDIDQLGPDRGALADLSMHGSAITSVRERVRVRVRVRFRVRVRVRVRVGVRVGQCTAHWGGGMAWAAKKWVRKRNG